MTKFCMSVDIHDVITCATFCDDRLRGSGWQGVEFPVFPLTCVVALTTLALLCECVKRVLVIVLVGNVLVLVLVLGTSVLETSMPIINPNPNLNVIACSNVMIYRQSILYTQAAVIKQQI